MAVAGSTMPAVLVEYNRLRREYFLVHTENRPTYILCQDLVEAERKLEEDGRVWIPASSRSSLAERLGAEIRPQLVYRG